MSHHLQVALNGGIEERLVQLNFSAEFYLISHRGMLYKPKSVCVGGQFLFIVSQFLRDRRQHVRLDGKVSVSVHVISEETKVVF